MIVHIIKGLQMKGVKKFYDQISEIYQAKKLTRRQISEKFGICELNLSTVLRKRGIELWDSGRNDQKRNDEIAELYEKKIFNREELCKKYKITMRQMRGILYVRGIKRWDGNKSRQKEIKLKTSPYYDWREDCMNNSYAVMFYKYNEKIIKLQNLMDCIVYLQERRNKT